MPLGPQPRIQRRERIPTLEGMRPSLIQDAPRPTTSSFRLCTIPLARDERIGMLGHQAQMTGDDRPFEGSCINKAMLQSRNALFECFAESIGILPRDQVT